MRGRTIASFGQAFPCWVDSSIPLTFGDSGTGVESVALSVALPITDSATGSDSAAVTFMLNLSKRGKLHLQPRAFTIRGQIDR